MKTSRVSFFRIQFSFLQAHSTERHKTYEFARDDSNNVEEDDVWMEGNKTFLFGVFFMFWEQQKVKSIGIWSREIFRKLEFLFSSWFWTGFFWRTEVIIFQMMKFLCYCKIIIVFVFISTFHHELNHLIGIFPVLEKNHSNLFEIYTVYKLSKLDCKFSILFCILLKLDCKFSLLVCNFLYLFSVHVSRNVSLFPKLVTNFFKKVLQQIMQLASLLNFPTYCNFNAENKWYLHISQFVGLFVGTDEVTLFFCLFSASLTACFTVITSLTSSFYPLTIDIFCIFHDSFPYFARTT